MNKFMKEAIKQAKIALQKEEVPIGAVVVKDGKIISRGYNKREASKNALMHAEIVAIDKACKKLGDWRLDDCEIYVTLEPCPMCAGAIANARIKTVFYGAKDKTSQDCLMEKILSSTRLNHTCDFKQDEEANGICAKLLSVFFKNRRK